MAVLIGLFYVAMFTLGTVTANALLGRRVTKTCIAEGIVFGIGFTVILLLTRPQDW